MESMSNHKLVADSNIASRPPCERHSEKVRTTEHQFPMPDEWAERGDLEKKMNLKRRKCMINEKK